MAKEPLQKIEEQLKCVICLNTYTAPKLLQCFHTNCQQCLVPLVVRDQQGKCGLTCPICRQVTPIPATGVAGLPPAFHINHLLEIRESLLQKPEAPVASPEGVVLTDVDSIKKLGHCSVHEGKELELHCNTCGELICTRCALKGGKHRGHRYEELDQAFDKYKKEITSSLEPMEKQVAVVQKALAQLDASCAEISDQRAIVEDNIHVTFRRLMEVLDARKTELIGQLHRLTQDKLKDLAAQRDQIETTLAQLTSCLHFMRESLKSSNEEFAMKMKKNTIKKVKELTTPFQSDTLKPHTEADIVFTALADLTAACQNYGQFVQCRVTGIDAKVTVVGEEYTAILHANDFKGKPCKDITGSLKCKISATANCSVERKGQGQYKITYQPTIKGRLELHIKVGDQHVRGSPFSITVAVEDYTPGWPSSSILRGAF